MRDVIVLMFSGQGSQYYNMGNELYQKHPRFKLWMDHCNDIAQSLINESLLDYIYKNKVPSHPFDNILYSNPALLSIQYSIYRVLREMGIQPAILLGYSLGELMACVAAGAITIEQAMEFSINSAKLLKSKTEEGGMLVVMASEDILLMNNSLFEGCCVAARNFEGNFVVSGPRADIERIEISLKNKRVICQRLSVRYAFHSESMDLISDEILKLAKKITYHPCRVPIRSSIDSRDILEVDENHLWRILRQPVEFGKAVRSISENKDYIFIDSGPSGSLSTNVKYILPGKAKNFYFETINQFGRNIDTIDKLEKGLSVLL